jgi:hypothetical protein
MVNSLPERKARYIWMILLICLTCMAVHIVVDSVGDFGFASRQSSSDNRPIRINLHSHDDDFLPTMIIMDARPDFALRETCVPRRVVTSQSILPQLPPPKHF